MLRSAISHLNDSMVDGSILLLSQHHQGDDNHGCYNNTSNHEPNDGTLVRAHILSKEDLWEVKGQDVQEACYLVIYAITAGVRSRKQHRDVYV